jgi:hypothetical protein
LTAKYHPGKYRGVSSAASDPPYVAFEGERRIAAGTLGEVAAAARRAEAGEPEGAVLAFDAATGRVVDLDLRGSEDEVRARYPATLPASAGRGRPRLGVVAREVTLLPRQWEWLAAQPGGASAALRRLVEAARREGGAADRARAARDAAYRFMSAMAGDLPGFEEASRALFAGDEAALRTRISSWPPDVVDQLLRFLHATPSESPPA